jgi:hypothetical protein
MQPMVFGVVLFSLLVQGATNSRSIGPYDAAGSASH